MIIQVLAMQRRNEDSDSPDVAAQLHIAEFIADDNGFGKINFGKHIIGSFRHPGIGFAVRMIVIHGSAVKDRIDAAAGSFNFIQHILMNVVQIIESHPALSDSTLVGDDHDPSKFFTQVAKGYQRPGYEFEFVPLVDVVASFRVDHAIAIEEEGPGGIDEGEVFQKIILNDRIRRQ